jgi:hypothetical protein
MTERIQQGSNVLKSQIALCALWKAEKLRSSPGALSKWERDLMAWDGREPLDGQLWGHLQHWAKKAGVAK